MQVCPSCGESVPARFDECPFCGTALAERHASNEERKVLTVLFCDLEGSTELGERLDPESLGEVLDLYFTAMTRVLKRHGGAIQKFIGDAVVAAFGLPVVNEDDALRAVRAAVEMGAARDRLNHQLERAYGVQLRTRIGVHTGEVVIRTAITDQQTLTGDTLNTAARLEQAAGSDDVFIGESTFRLVRDAVTADRMEPLDLKGKSGRIPAYRLRAVFGDEQASRHHDAPIVGRESELGQLVDAFARATDERRCILATVLGEAGVGKSRLVRALIDEAGNSARVLRGRCLPYGEDITFLPLLSIVREAAGIGAEDPVEVARDKVVALIGDEEVTRRIGSAFGWTDEELPVAELFWGVRELLECLARTRPLVVVVDDVHWAAPTLLELLEHLVETVEDGPMLLLCTARPDMLEARPAWSQGPRAGRLVLDRLPDGATELVIENLLDGMRLPEEVSGMIVRSAEGNPLFVEQLVTMLIERGVLVEAGDGWQTTRPIAQLDIPPSIQALLTARLDRLSAEERGVAEPAAVIGLDFPSTAIRELVAAAVRPEVDARLDELIQRQLVRRRPLEEREFEDHRFNHLLIRDAAYQRILKRGRADLHERFADWLQHFDESHGRPGERDEVVGYHLEQAVIHRQQLGALDVHVNVLAARAAEKLAAAGQRAFVRGDLPAAVTLLKRAVDLLPRLDPTRLSLLPDLAEALMETGDFAAAVQVLEEAVEPTSAEAAVEVARAALVRLMIDLQVGADAGWAEHAETEIGRARQIFEAAGHHRGLATAARLRCTMHGSALRWNDAVADAQAVIEHARRAGDLRQQRRGAIAYATASLYGPTHVDEAIERCQELIAAIDGDRRSQAVVQLSLAQLLALRGDFEEARTLVNAARRMLHELGQSVLAASTSIDTAPIELLAGDAAAAEARLREDLAALDGMGESYLRSTVAGLLARILVRHGPSDEAERLVSEVREAAAADDVDAQILWRSALSRQRAHTGHVDEALHLADEAVALTNADGAPVLAAQSLLDRAFVLLTAGREADATADLARADRLYLDKGVVVISGSRPEPVEQPAPGAPA